MIEARNTPTWSASLKDMQERLATTRQALADPDDGPGADLLNRARAGDADALNALFRENWLPVYRSVARFAGTPAEAEDLTQEVFVRAVQAIGSYGGAEVGVQYRAYLLRIARNLAIDRWRSRQAAGVIHVPISEESLRQYSHAESGPESAVIRREEYDMLLAALDRLPDAYSDVLRQRVLCGRTAAEVGALTGQTANAVRQLQFRALAALRKELAAERYGEDR
jgi:RNA polymerase sigma-70 factor, ECF subfamily